MRREERTAATAGFTLVELLVVIAIIGTLVALLLPAVQAAREAARRSSCLNNLRQIGSAIHMYHDQHGAFPPGGISPNACCNKINFTSWTIQLLPFLEHRALYDQYDQNEANEALVNREVREHFVPTYSCPSDIMRTTLSKPASGGGQQLQYMPGSYRGVGGKSDGITGWWDNMPGYKNLPRRWRGVFHVVDGKSLQPERIAAVRDGTSNTLLVGESVMRPSSRVRPTPLSRRTYWAYTYGSYNRSDAVAQSRTLLGDYDRCSALGGPGDFDPCNRAWGSQHGDVVNFVLCDASVHSYSIAMDMHLFANAATIAGREYVELP